MGAQKARLVADVVRGRSVGQALNLLAFMPQKTAVILTKLIRSAVASAEQRQVMDTKQLYVSAVCVDEGPSHKRFMPRARGRAAQVRKKTSHLQVVLEERQ